MGRFKWFLCATCIMATAASLQAGESYFHNGSFVSLTVSDRTIVVQRDTTAGSPDVAGFFEAHPCLDPDSGQKCVDRAFYQYWLRGGCEFALAVADLGADSTVNRLLPVYLTPDSGEFKVTDLVSVKFQQDVSQGSALALLASVGLHLEDSSRFILVVDRPDRAL